MVNPHGSGPGQPAVIEAEGRVARALFTVLAGAMTLIGLATLLATRAVFPLILTAVGLVVLVFLLPRFLEFRRWHTPEFHIDRWPLELGGQSTIVYRLRPKQQPSLQPAPVELAIECAEEVRYTVGTDTRTDRATVYRHEATATGEVTASGFEATFRLAIPLDAGAPTLDLGSNDITWRIEAEIRGKGYPKNTRRARLLVVPTLDAGDASFWGGR